METLIAENWKDYALIDTGNKKRLERFGTFYCVRPDSSALWKPKAPHHEGWKHPDAEFFGDKHQPWKLVPGVPLDGWDITWNKITTHIRPTPFRHMGIFPEQAYNWGWITKTVEAMRASGTSKPRVLNLFGYTGMASIVAADAGAEVCHVDAAKNTVQWAAENARLNGLEIRWIVDDVIKFMQREVKRGSFYDLIIMDPPVFGRGPKGEIWRLEEQVVHLSELTNQLLRGPKPAVLMNFYATELYPYSLMRTMHQALQKQIPTLSLGALFLKEEASGELLQTGYSLRSS